MINLFAVEMGAVISQGYIGHAAQNGFYEKGSWK
jgi:hypothetical protein